MKTQLKKVVAAAVPAILVAGTQVTSADEVQSIAAQAIAQAASQSATPPAPPAPVAERIRGLRN